MQKIKLDVSKKLNIPVVLTKQGNVGHKFKIAVFDNGSPYDVPADATMSVWYSGDGGQGNYSQINGKSAFQISGNTVTVELIAQMLRKAGNYELCLILDRPDGSQIGLWNIPYFVEPVPGMGSLGAKQYFSALSEQIQKIRDMKTPHMGNNGNWWFGNDDTGVQAQGEKGDPGEQGPQGEKGDPGEAGAKGTDGTSPHIGENGNWWIGETDTGVSAGGTGSGLPEVTTEDNGKAAVVMNGQWVAMAVSIPDDAHINSLIDAKLGVIENGTY